MTLKSVKRITPYLMLEIPWVLTTSFTIFLMYWKVSSASVSVALIANPRSTCRTGLESGDGIERNRNDAHLEIPARHNVHNLFPLPPPTPQKKKRRMRTIN